MTEKELKDKRKRYNVLAKKVKDLEAIEDKQFADNSGELATQYENTAKSLKGSEGDFVAMGGAEIDIVDSEGQMLGFRVGDVYHNIPEKATKALWINYQRRYMSSNMQGPFLMSKKMWNMLKKEIDYRFSKEYKKITECMECGKKLSSAEKKNNKHICVSCISKKCKGCGVILASHEKDDGGNYCSTCAKVVPCKELTEKNKLK
ncbi:MAG: hypothetical protein AABY32_01830 [Nanoarchaeota archaeon]